MSRLPRPVRPEVVPPPVVRSVEHQSPPVIVVNQQPGQSRIEASGVGFFHYAGAVLILCFVGVFLLAGYGVLSVRNAWLAESAERAERAATARRILLPILQPRGISAISTDSDFGELGDKATLQGICRDKEGRLREFVAVWTVAQFGSDRRWEFVSVFLDGEIVIAKQTHLVQ